MALAVKCVDSKYRIIRKVKIEEKFKIRAAVIEKIDGK